MNEYSRADTIDHYFELIDSGQMEFSTLRKTLEADSIPMDEINIVVRQIDNQLIRSAQKRTDHSVGRNLFLGGLILSALGLILTISTYLGLINTGNVYVLAYGPFLGGLVIAMTGKSKMKK